MRTLNDCYWHAETRREYRTVGLGPIVANRSKSGLLDIPSYRSISRTNWQLTFADGAGTTTKMVPTDDGGHIVAIYGDFVEVFSKTKAETLPPHRWIDHAIASEPSYNLPYGRIYNLSEFELRTRKAYIQANLADGFIPQSSSPAAAPILFPKNKDGGLRCCVDYHALNLATVKNQYYLPLISEMPDSVREAKIS